MGRPRKPPGVPRETGSDEGQSGGLSGAKKSARGKGRKGKGN